jgi:hypothetical protein
MWWWILVWAVLVIAAAGAFTLLSWRLVRQVIALGRQLGASADELSLVMTPLHDTYRPARSVLTDPSGRPAAANTRSARRGLRRR